MKGAHTVTQQQALTEAFELWMEMPTNKMAVRILVSGAPQQEIKELLAQVFAAGFYACASPSSR